MDIGEDDKGLRLLRSSMRFQRAKRRWLILNTLKIETGFNFQCSYAMRLKAR